MKNRIRIIIFFGTIISLLFCLQMVSGEQTDEDIMIEFGKKLLNDAPEFIKKGSDLDKAKYAFVAYNNILAGKKLSVNDDYFDRFYNLITSMDPTKWTCGDNTRNLQNVFQGIGIDVRNMATIEGKWNKYATLDPISILNPVPLPNENHGGLLLWDGNQYYVFDAWKHGVTNGGSFDNSVNSVYNGMPLSDWYNEMKGENYDNFFIGGSETPVDELDEITDKMELLRPVDKTVKPKPQPGVSQNEPNDELEDDDDEDDDLLQYLIDLEDLFIDPPSSEPDTVEKEEVVNYQTDDGNIYDPISKTWFDEAGNPFNQDPDSTYTDSDYKEIWARICRDLGLIEPATPPGPLSSEGVNDNKNGNDQDEPNEETPAVGVGTISELDKLNIPKGFQTRTSTPTPTASPSPSTPSTPVDGGMCAEKGACSWMYLSGGYTPGWYLYSPKWVNGECIGLIDDSYSKDSPFYCQLAKCVCSNSCECTATNPWNKYYKNTPEPAAQDSLESASSSAAAKNDQNNLQKEFCDPGSGGLNPCMNSTFAPATPTPVPTPTKDIPDVKYNDGGSGKPYNPACPSC